MLERTLFPRRKAIFRELYKKQKRKKNLFIQHRAQ